MKSKMKSDETWIYRLHLFTLCSHFILTLNVKCLKPQEQFFDEFDDFGFELIKYFKSFECLIFFLKTIILKVFS